ncbi:MAG: PKD domain-containing protein [Thermodesulfobacteriota bacterium]
MYKEFIRTIVYAAFLCLLLVSLGLATTAQYTYDTLNRLDQVQYEDGTIIHYTYDAAGNRTAREVIAVTPPPYQPPVANPGPNQTIWITGSTVQLNGSGSYDPAGLPLTYLWTIVSKPPGSNAAFDDPTSPNPAFIADLYGDYVIQLVVSDSQGSSQPMTMMVSLHDDPPVADPGPDQTITTIGARVNLDGTGSHDPNGQAITYQWSLNVPEGSSAVLDNPASPTPGFVADIRGDYTAQLVVRNATGESPPAAAKITYINLPPVADAGEDQIIRQKGSQVTLDGTGSADANGDAITYWWTLGWKPAGSTAALSDPESPTPTFIADKPGLYLAYLVVMDNWSSSDLSPVEIRLTSGLVPVLLLLLD